MTRPSPSAPPEIRRSALAADRAGTEDWTPAAPPRSAADAQIAALVDEVQAEPDADDARHVLADALLAEGDPRGELIALQLAGHGRGSEAPPEAVGPSERALRGATPEALDRARHRDRIDQLLREHGKRWLGALREVTYRARFARGFLTRLELNGRWTTSDEAWVRHAGDPALATVEDLLPGRSVGQIYARFMASPALRALRRVEVFDRPTLAALRQTPAQLVHVACPRWKIGKYVHELAAHVLPACERFASLRSFAVHLDGAASVLASPIFDRLRALTVAGGLAQGLTLWPRLPPTMSLTIARTAMLDDCAVNRVSWTGALHLWREGDQVIGRGSGDWLVRELVERFAVLPVGLRRLEIDGAAAHATALCEAAQRRGIELVIGPVPRRIGYVAVPDTR